MAIQECYYFNGVGVYWGSVKFLQIVFSLSHILVYLGAYWCSVQFLQIIFLLSHIFVYL